MKISTFVFARNGILKKLKFLLVSVLFFIVTLAVNPGESRADYVGTTAFQDSMWTFNDVTWTILSAKQVTLSGFTVTGVTSITWNSDNLLYYGIVKAGGTNRRLCIIDPSTGICTDIGPMGGQFSSLTYSSSNGIMYAIGGAGGGAIAERLYSVNLTTGATTFLAGPFSLGADGEVIAYNYDDNHIYHWSGNSTANMEKINASTFVATSITQTGTTHGEIFGAVYKGGGVFDVTDISSRALSITSAGVVSLIASGLPDDVRGLGFVDPLLPVELTSFTSSINGRNVILNWITSEEINNSGFDIERSTDQISNEWIRVGSIKGNGTSVLSHEYSFTDRNLASGNYNYRLKQIDYNGNFEYFNLNNEVNIGIPARFELSQNYPNPFNPTTSINYSLPVDGKVSIRLFDMSGKEVSVLVNEVKSAGYYSVNFNAASLSSGVYFYSIEANNFTATKKMLLLK